MERNLIERVSVYYKRPEDGKVLTVEWEGGEFNGCRGMPHGTVELGETLQQTGIRECKEETGLIPILGRKIFEYNTFDRRVHESVFEALSVCGTMNQTMKAGYMSDDEILKREDVHPKLKELVSGINLHGLDGFIGYNLLLSSNK